MSECECLTQEIEIRVFKKQTKWYEGWAWAPLYMGSEYMTIHAKTIDELDAKKKEIHDAFQKKYPERSINVVG